MFSVSGAENGSLLIAGSDKRGTIYGLFHISELMGVSPFVHFADVVPAPQKEIIFSEKDSMQSKEPSVKYRGFLSMMNGLRSETGHFPIMVDLLQKCMT